MRICAMLMVVVAVLPAGAHAAEPAALAKARALYNAGSFDEAVSQARAARKEPAYADAAALVMARALLERYRAGRDPADLTSAREALASIRPAALSPRDQADFQIGLGVALYLADNFGVSAELFETALGRASMLASRDRLRLLDWWATAIDREAQTRPADRRGTLFARIARRMETELREDPANPVASYWAAVAARGEGDLDRAWDLAAAAWVRGTLLPDP